MKRNAIILIAAAIILLAAGCGNKPQVDTESDHLAVENGVQADIPFEPGVFVDIEPYKNQPDEYAAAQVVVTNLEAIVENDKEKFISTFMQDVAAEEFTYVMDPSSQYRFHSIASIRFRKPDQIEIVVDMAVYSPELPVESRLINRTRFYNLEKENNKWKILTLD